MVEKFEKDDVLGWYYNNGIFFKETVYYLGTTHCRFHDKVLEELGATKEELTVYETKVVSRPTVAYWVLGFVYVVFFCLFVFLANLFGGGWRDLFSLSFWKEVIYDELRENFDFVERTQTNQLVALVPVVLSKKEARRYFSGAARRFAEKRMRSCPEEFGYDILHVTSRLLYLKRLDGAWEKADSYYRIKSREDKER